MLSKLRSWLIEEPGRVYLHSNLNLVAENRGLPFSLIVSRGLCQQVALNLSSVQKEDRASALRLQVTRISPFREFDYFVRWKGTVAEVWYWDKARMASILKDGNFRIAGSYPASIFVPQSAEYELVRYEDGFEARIWRDGYIKASRWFVERPDQGELGLFCKSTSNSVATDREISFTEVDGDHHGRKPVVDTEAGTEALIRDAGLLAIVALVMFTFMMFSWNSIAIAKLYWQSNDVEKRVAALEEQSESQFRLREIAFEAQDFVSLIRSQEPFPSQLEMMSGFGELLPDDNVRLVAWKYTGDRLLVTLTGTEFDLVAYTNAFDRSPLFTGVDVRRGKSSDELIVQMEVVRVID